MQDLTPQIRTRLRRVEWLVLAFLIGTGLLVLLALGWWLKTTGDARGWFVLEVPYYTYLEDAGTIREGTPVKMMGFTIGKVDRVITAEDNGYNRSRKFNVFVHFLVREPFFGYIHTDSTSRLGGAGIELLGGSWLELTRAEGLGVPTVLITNTTALVLNDRFGHAAPSTERTNQFLNYRPFRRRDNGYFITTETSISLMNNAEASAAILRNALPGLTNQLAEILNDIHGLVADLRPSLTKAGGMGDLLIPTNLTSRLALTLDDLHGLQERLAPVMTNANQTLLVAQETSRDLKPLFSDVQGAVTNIQGLVTALQQQVTSTNLLGNVSRLADKAALLADTTDTLMRRHWLFRSAFQTNSARTTPRNEQLLDRRRF